ncbi:MAG: phosphotransferase [Pseudomonadota bacterium]
MDALPALVSAAFPAARLVAQETLKGGVSADVTLIELELGDGSVERCVLRAHGETHCGHPPELEFQLLSALHEFGLPVARPLAFSAGGESDGMPCVLSEYAEGSTAISAAEADTRIDAMAWQLAAIHTAPTQSLPDLPKRTDPQPELLTFLPDTTDWAPVRKRIAHLGPQPFEEPLCLLHGDYWPSNIVWQDDRIVAVIDWEDAALGDPLSDVACAQLELRYVFGPWGAERFLNAYARHRDVDPVRLAWWQAYVAAAGAKSMGEWGLDPDRVATMRAIAHESVREAATVFAK